MSICSLWLGQLLRDAPCSSYEALNHVVCDYVQDPQYTWQPLLAERRTKVQLTTQVGAMSKLGCTSPIQAGIRFLCILGALLTPSHHFWPPVVFCPRPYICVTVVRAGHQTPCAVAPVHTGDQLVMLLQDCCPLPGLPRFCAVDMHLQRINTPYIFVHTSRHLLESSSQVSCFNTAQWSYNVFGRRLICV